MSASNAGYTMFRGSVKGTGYVLYSPVSPSLPLPCVAVCHHISIGLYKKREILMTLGHGVVRISQFLPDTPLVRN